MSTVSINNLVATWNDPATNFRAIRMNAVNTASGAGSLLLELLVNGANRLTLNRDGVLFASGQVQSPGFAISGGGGVNLSGTGVGIASDQTLRFSSTTSAGGAADVLLRREAANTLGLRNGVNPQNFHIFNSFTDGSNWERGTVGWDSNTFRVVAEAAGTGGLRAVQLRTGAMTATLTDPGGFNVTGNISSSLGIFRNFNSGTRIHLSNTDGVIGLYNNAINGFDRLLFGGTTSAFPAIRRTGASLDFVLADVSGYCDIRMGGRLSFGGQNESPRLRVNGSGLDLVTASEVSFTKLRINELGLLADCDITRDAADTVALRRTSNPNTFRVYRTFTNSANYERGSISWTSFDMQIGTERAGTGLVRGLNLATNGTTRLAIGGTGSLAATVTSYSCTSTGQAWTYATTIGFETGDNTIFNHATTGATLRMEHGNRTFYPTGAEWSLGSWPGGRWNSGYIDNLYLHQNVTSLTDWERGAVAWSGNQLRISTEKSGTGVVRPISFWTNGLERLQIGEQGDFNLSCPAGLASLEVDEFFVTAPSGFELSTGDGAIGMNADQLSVVGDTRIVGDVVVDGGPTNSLTISTNGSQVYPTAGSWSLGGEPFRFSTGYINNLFLYNSYTNASNWERGAVAWVSNVLEIYTQRNGSGSARPIIFRTNGGNRLQIGGAGTITATLAANQNFIIAGLPTANPNVAGALWNDGGTVKVSAG